jgi:hypothetical protein
MPAHDDGAYDKLANGDRVRIWPGVRESWARSYEATVIDAGPVFFGKQRCVRVRADNGMSDYIALTHVEALNARSR